ncbi:ABC transporter substrate-binding protein [Metasolibacillus meyeri]|uniref:ABC transporter substrate-binding protein n=1 Tax=Metasolibacillus meyeri TaxID=1071052 RepID=UPI001EE717AB|nr:ABC transporter substrate-binding protein [Metasolibacillus meyeri]
MIAANTKQLHLNLCLLFNTQSGPLAELEVRQAIQYAINKEHMVESITHGTEKVANTLFWDAIPYANFITIRK